MPLKVKPSTTLAIDPNRNDLQHVAKLLHQTIFQMNRNLTDTSSKQVDDFKETIETPLKACTNFYNHTNVPNQKSLIIAYVRPFTDHIFSRYRLETMHYVRCDDDIAGIKEHLSDLIQNNQIVVRVLPLLKQHTAEQFELESYGQGHLTAIYETLASVSDPTAYFNELFSINVTNWHQPDASEFHNFSQELPLLRQAAIKRTKNPKALTIISPNCIRDTQKLAKTLHFV